MLLELDAVPSDQGGGTPQVHAGLTCSPKCPREDPKDMIPHGFLWSLCSLADPALGY